MQINYDGFFLTDMGKEKSLPNSSSMEKTIPKEKSPFSFDGFSNLISSHFQSFPSLLEGGALYLPIHNQVLLSYSNHTFVWEIYKP